MLSKRLNLKCRLKAIRDRFTARTIDCLIVTNFPNVTYTTGFTGHDSWAVVTGRGVYLITDSRYSEQARGECPDCKIIQRTGSMAKAVAGLIEKQKSLRIIGIENSTSLGAFTALKQSIDRKLKPVTDLIESVRDVKDISEVAAIKKAARIAAKSLKLTRKHIQPGITENKLAALLDFHIRSLDAANSFDTIVAFGANASRPHHQPGTKRLKKNDSVLIDFGARYDGYCCDITRCMTVGKTTSLYRKAYEAVKDAQTAAIKLVRAGVKISEVDAAAREVIASNDLPVYGHGTGHGLGLEVHELPVVSPKSKGKLEAGMVVTIEPGIYIPGKLGIRIEDDVLVTDTGCEILTSECEYYSN